MNSFSVQSVCLLLLLVSFAGCGGSSTKRVLTAREQFDLGMRQYAAKQYLKATENLQAVVFNYPGESMIDTAQFYLAQSYVGQKDFALGEVEFNRLLVNYPSSAFATEAQFMKAVCAYDATPKHFGLDQSSLVLSIQQFEDFIIDHPESDLLGEAQRLLAQAREKQAHKLFQAGIVYVRINSPSAARIYFQRVVDEHTSSPFAQRALFELAELEYRLEKYDIAQDKYQGFATAYPSSNLVPRAKGKLAESAYRSALQALDANDTTLARTRFESFQANFPAHPKSRKANDYLRKIGSVDTTRAESGGK